MLKQVSRYLSLGMALVASASAFEVGTELPRPDKEQLLVQPQHFSLPSANFAKETQVVVFFYSASWCAPCEKLGQKLKQTYPDFKAESPALEFVTFSVDFTTRSRADYLRDEHYPWPAIAPIASDDSTWKVDLEDGTPQFQAFALGEDTLEAITTPGEGGAVIKAALRYLLEKENSNVPSS